MTSQLYEIRRSDNGKVLLLNGTHRQVAKFFEKQDAKVVRDQKIDGVIVLFVQPEQVPA